MRPSMQFLVPKQTNKPTNLDLVETQDMIHPEATFSQVMNLWNLASYNAFKMVSPAYDDIFIPKCRNRKQ